MIDASPPHSISPGNYPARVLVFGGTFDPPHLAHARLPALAAAQLHCDHILYIPAAINPLKTESPPTAKEHRLAMLLLTIADVPNATISAIELDRAQSGGGPSYTIDTLRLLAQQYETPAARVPTPVAAESYESISNDRNSTELYLLIGCDQALNFHQWKEWQQILMLATPAVMLRPPWDKEAFAKELQSKYSKVEAEQWLGWLLRLPTMDISATQIRKRLKAGEPTDGLLDPAVAEYIRSNRLYQ